MRVLVALMIGVVYGGLALGNKMMIQRLTKASVLNRVDGEIAKRIAIAVDKTKSFASGKDIAVALDISNMPPAQRKLPRYMMDEDGLTYDVLEYPLHVAVARGNYGEVAQLLAEGKNINDFDQSGRAPIHVAVETGDMHTVSLLIKNGADINIGIEESWRYRLIERWDSKGRDLMEQESVEKGDIEPIVPIYGKEPKILKKKMKLSYSLDVMQTPIHLAVRDRHLDVLALLLLADASVSPVPKEDKPYIDSATDIATRNGDLASIVLLDVAGANFRDEGQYGTNPFRLAVMGGRIDVVEYLSDRMPKEEFVEAMRLVNSAPMAEFIRQKIVDVPLDTIPGYPVERGLLNSHAYRGNVEVVKLLIDKYGMNPNAKDEAGRFPLQDTLLSPNLSKENKEKTVMALLERGANPLAHSEQGDIVLDIARFKGLGHLFLPYLEGKIEIPPDISQKLARQKALAAE